MELFAIIFCLLAVYMIVAIVRIDLVYNHIDTRIKEVFASPDWFEYWIDMDDAYTRAMWDFRKWTYRDFFPEVVK